MAGTRKGYWQDAYQVTFQSHVARISGNNIILDETFFYPASGGQACDRGVLVIAGKSFNVQEVLKEGDNVIHAVKPAPGNAVVPGMIADGMIDWDRRNALMRAHSAQHVLSARIAARFHLSTTEVSIQPDIASINLNNQINLDQLEEVLTIVNRDCTTSHPVTTSISPRDKAISDHAGRIRGEMSTEDPVRIVEIKDIDIMCCGGTHVKDTSEIGLILVIKFKGGREIKFVVGKEAVAMLAKMNTGMISAAATLNKDMLQLAEAVEKQVKNSKLLEEQADQLAIELLDREARCHGLQASSGIRIHVLKAITNKKIATAHFNNFSPGSILAIQGDKGSLQIYSNADTVKANELIQALVERLGGKGGGNPKIAQGMLEKEPEDLGALLMEILSKS
ncbi:MAG: hypothetical protein GYA24_15320 [Candidatus Lokiarchaeota archaeon]|nr:hypothetical protein [Candidatus Lokiarchaeota archaeon]